MTLEEQYPSTDDCARVLQTGDDPVLICLCQARDRVALKHTIEAYIASPKDSFNGAVCAIGAVFAVDGLDGKTVLLATHTLEGSRGLVQALDKQLSDEAKEAITLLNRAAVDLYPESAEFGAWSGPLEYVNQALYVDEDGETDEDFEHEIKGAVLDVYDKAIQDRSKQTV